VEHYHPSHDNPGFTQEMDDSFKSTMTASAYEHEILAEFGTEDSGVFNKTMIDDAKNKFNYCYLPPTDEILRRAEKEFGERPNFINYTKYNPAPPNPWRCMGVDYDAYQAGSSLLVLEYVPDLQQFMVMQRIEIPKGEYTLDNAVNSIIEMNDIYNPSWIFCDRGYGKYNCRLN